MPNEFSYIELTAMRQFMFTMNYSDIAELICRNVEEVASFIESISLSEGKTTYQQKLAKKEKTLLLKKAVGRPANPVKPEKAKPAPAVKKQKAKTAKKIKELPPVVVWRQNAIIKKPEEKVLATRQIDFSRQVKVQIDKKTWIYIKADEDPAEAKRRYIARLVESQSKITGTISQVVVANKPPQPKQGHISQQSNRHKQQNRL